MVGNIVRVLPLMLLFLLGGCFVVSEKPVLNATSNPGLPDQKSLLQLIDGPIKLQQNVQFDVEPGSKEYTFYEVGPRLTAAHFGSELNPKAVRFVPLFKPDGIYLAQFKNSSKQYYYYIVHHQNDRFYVNEMKLSPKERDEAFKRKIPSVYDKGVSPKTVDGLKAYARYWVGIRGADWIMKDPASYTYRLYTDPTEQEIMREAHMDFMCLAYAGHPEDPAVKKLRAPYNDGRILSRVDEKPATGYCKHGVEPTQSPSVTFALARAKYKIEEYTGSRQNPGALDLAERLHQQNFGLGSVLLSEAYRWGKGVPRDAKRAEQILKAADQEDPNILNALGYHYRGGHAGGIRNEEAAYYFTRAADKGHASAMASLGVMYRFGNGVKKDLKKAISLFRKSAEGRDVIGLSELGKAYYFGEGVSRDYKKAMPLFQASKKLGSGEAAYYIGYLYLYGLGTKANQGLALNNFKTSADRNFVSGRYAYAENYYNDLKKAKRGQPQHDWLVKASKTGRNDALYVLAKKYIHGFDVNQSGSEAAKLLQKAIANGHIGSMLYLAAHYEIGSHLKRDFAKAEQLYQKAANKGNLIGMYYLAEFYRKGNAGNNRKSEAKGWYQKAANKGHQKSKDALKKYYASLSAPSAPSGPSAPPASSTQSELERAQKFERWAREGKDIYYYYAGLTYLTKLGNADKAEENFLISSRKGNTWSQYYMGLIHSQYDNYPKHWKPEYALMWLYTAEKTGLKAGKDTGKISKYYGELEKLLKPEQRIRALDRSRKCFGSNYRNC
ncbi:tetratricopeptide repeat protein [Sneathiella limimaris]|uniref:tetratricopeptide repeat protein n=1 Tax=Sneathiella limimaris TaxID=1964213 RepID=UPI00146A7E40|nr:tetratricopeptide repeat protein [Sneathiella limimaris]